MATAIAPLNSAISRATGRAVGGGGRFLLNTVNRVNLRSGMLIAATATVLFGGPGFAPSAAARDSLGVFESWGAFRDPGVPRCYAIARSDRHGARFGFATVGTWPRARIRGQVHFRMSRPVGKGTRVDLRISGQDVPLAASGSSAWTLDARGDATVLAAMRSAQRMTVRAHGPGGFADSYPLAGAASAMDAALVGCAGR